MQKLLRRVWSFLCWRFPELNRPPSPPCEEETICFAYLSGRTMIGVACPKDRTSGQRTRWYLIPAICDADVTLPNGDIVGLVKPVVRLEDVRR